MPVFVFLGYLAAGTLVALATVRLPAEGRTFFLFNAGLGLVLGAVALLVRLAPGADGLRPPPAVAALGGAGLVLVAVYLLLGALGREVRPLLVVAALLLVAFLAADLATRPGAIRPGLLHLANGLTSAWLTGAVLVAMILGHYYLVLPRLSIDPLRRLFRFALAGLIARLAVIVWAGAVWWRLPGSELGAAVLLGPGVFVLQRLLFGLLVPLVLAGLTWQTIELRSTQSATGILYVVVFLTLVGEALSVYLSLGAAVPI